MRTNDYRFISERALDACSTYEVESISLLATESPRDLAVAPDVAAGPADAEVDGLVALRRVPERAHRGRVYPREAAGPERVLVAVELELDLPADDEVELLLALVEVAAAGVARAAARSR